MNRLKQRLAEGRRTLALFLVTPSPDTAEILAGAGFDCLIVDHEHGLGTVTEAVAQLRAMKGAGTTSMIRVPSAAGGHIQRALDSGFECILCPGIESREEAEAAVRACRYPPAGQRGAGGGLRAAAYGRNASYYADSTSDTLIALQVESANAVARIEEIASVEGVDMVVIGPRDLSASIGRLNRFADPDVKALFAEAERRILATGRYMATVIYPGLTLGGMFERGHHMIIAGSDTGLLVQGAQALVESLDPPSKTTG